MSYIQIELEREMLIYLHVSWWNNALILKVWRLCECSWHALITVLCRQWKKLVFHTVKGLDIFSNGLLMNYTFHVVLILRELRKEYHGVIFPNKGCININTALVTGNTLFCLRYSLQRMWCIIQNHLHAWPSVSVEFSNLDPRFTSLLSHKRQNHYSVSATNSKEWMRQVVQGCFAPFTPFIILSLFYWWMKSFWISFLSHIFSFLP